MSLYVSKVEKSWHHHLYSEPTGLFILPHHCSMKTPPRKHNAKHASTVTKTRFFDAFNRRSPTETLQDMIQSVQFPYCRRTTQRWLKTRREASGAHKIYYRGDKHHKKPSKIIDAQLDTLLDPKNPIRIQDLQT